MANNIFEQFDEAYSRWSILDKVGKEMQFDENDMCEHCAAELQRKMEADD